MARWQTSIAAWKRKFGDIRDTARPKRSITEGNIQGWHEKKFHKQWSVMFFELNQIGVRVPLYIGDVEGEDGGCIQCQRAAGMLADSLTSSQLDVSSRLRQNWAQWGSSWAVNWGGQWVLVLKRETRDLCSLTRRWGAWGTEWVNDTCESFHFWCFLYFYFHWQAGTFCLSRKWMWSNKYSIYHLTVDSPVIGWLCQDRVEIQD